MACMIIWLGQMIMTNCMHELELCHADSRIGIPVLRKREIMRERTSGKVQVEVKLQVEER